MADEKRACRDDSEPGGPDHAGKKLRLEQDVDMKTADQQMGDAGDDEGARKETTADVHMEENVCEGQDLIEDGAGLACLHKQVGFIDGGDLAFKDAHGGFGVINKDDRTPACIKKAAKEACLVGDHVYSNQSTPRKGASIGPRHFTSSREMLKFFDQLRNGWPLNYNINKYEHMMLEDLLKKGHPNFSEKIGTAIGNVSTMFCHYRRT
ncbi:hypothetical protein GOP47_0026509 [Adiantum capillus-veneris]|nr:hypothetical protein GOP47_0026509 [Adiantum capillus-veneris]